MSVNEHIMQPAWCRYRIAPVSGCSFPLALFWSSAHSRRTSSLLLLWWLDFLLCFWYFLNVFYDCGVFMLLWRQCGRSLWLHVCTSPADFLLLCLCMTWSTQIANQRVCLSWILKKIKAVESSSVSKSPSVLLDEITTTTTITITLIYIQEEERQARKGRGFFGSIRRLLYFLSLFT